MPRLRLLAAALGILGFALTASAQPGFKLVANRSVSSDSLTAKEVSQLFFKKSDTWPDGASVVPVDQKVDSSVRAAFSRAVHRRSPSAVDAYWQKRIFSGRGLPPVTQATDAQVLAFVRSTPGAIGYVSAGASTQGVKVVTLR